MSAETPNLESLPAWAKRSFATTSARQAQATVLEWRTDAEIWPLFLDASVVNSFLPRDLAPQCAPARRSDAEKAVLGFAQNIHAPGGLEWVLKPEWRREILSTILDSPELDEALHRTSPLFSDQVSTGIRMCVRKPHVPFDLSQMDLAMLEGLRVAVASLDGTPGLILPSLDQLDGELEMRRLLAQFRRMIGRKPEAGSDSAMDLFVGRNVELEKMRTFVGAAPDNVFTTLKRSFSRSRSVLPVWGIGGVGKTTLVARFMLEHAEVAATRSPFAYLDFDRTMVSAQDRLGLLVEMCIQTGAQFPDLLEPMSALARRAKSAAGAEPAPRSLIESLAREFRAAVDRLLDKRESLLERNRPFLLVFDTFEVVQYSESSVPELEEFIRCFSNEKEKGAIWPRLRLIISGRQRVEKFLEPIVELDAVQVGPLDVDSSTDLLCSLARDASKPIRRDDAKTLITSIAKLTTHPDLGLEPLRLRLLGQIFVKEKEDGPRIMDRLISEFSKPLEANGLAAEMLIDGVLVRRVLEHVQDRRVRALADPGLVVRRITPDVIQKVMTRGTADPSQSRPSSAGDDAEPDKPWEVSEQEARAIYDEFRKQVDLVEPDGDGLKHRPDVREQMLPLIRARRRNTFERLQRLAFDYFSTQADANPQDVRAAAEAVYHGLWVNENLTRLNQFWHRLGNYDPRINQLDFEEGSVARAFLRAKAGAVLTTFELSPLPPDVRVDWLDARSSALLTERRLSSAILTTLRLASGDQFQDLSGAPETAAVAVRLLYRAGLWSDAVELATQHLDTANLGDLSQADDLDQILRDQRPQSRASAHLTMARTWATIAGKVGGTRESLLRLGNLAASMRDSIARMEMAAHAFLGILQTGGSLRQMGRMFSIVEKGAGHISEENWLRAPRILRLAALILRDSSPHLLHLWAQSRDQLPRELNAPGFYDVLSRLFEGRQNEELVALAKRGSGSLNKLDEIWWKEKSTVLESMQHNPAVRWSFLMLAIYDHSDWVRPLGNALAQMISLSTSGVLSEHLARKGFQAPDRFDGIGIADGALGNGRFLELARELAEWRGLKPELRKSLQSPYPQDVFEIGQALLRWHSTLSDECSGEDRHGPPPPPPVVHKDDPQKNRWGGSAERGGRRLRVHMLETEPETFTFNAVVESTDDTPLEAPVIFHLHSTYPRSIIKITKIRDNHTAVLEEVASYGQYTLGVQVKSAREKWIGLEIDLGLALDLPERFLQR